LDVAWLDVELRDRKQQLGHIVIANNTLELVLRTVTDWYGSRGELDLMRKENFMGVWLVYAVLKRCHRNFVRAVPLFSGNSDCPCPSSIGAFG
jgi:hypothetical protein